MLGYLGFDLISSIVSGSVHSQNVWSVCENFILLALAVAGI